MATSSAFLQESPPRLRQRLSTTSGVEGLQDRYNYGTLIHNRVFIGGLHSSVTEADLEQKFGSYGLISDIKIIKKPEMEKGYAFITFDSTQDASKLLDETSGARVKINGLESKVAPAFRKPSQSDSVHSISPTGATRGGGVFEGAEIHLKPVVTPKRNRLHSSPAAHVDTSQPAPIPVPMPGYKPVHTPKPGNHSISLNHTLH